MSRKSVEASECNLPSNYQSLKSDLQTRWRLTSLPLPQTATLEARRIAIPLQAFLELGASVAYVIAVYAIQPCSGMKVSEAPTYLCLALLVYRSREKSVCFLQLMVIARKTMILMRDE